MTHNTNVDHTFHWSASLVFLAFEEKEKREVKRVEKGKK